MINRDKLQEIFDKLVIEHAKHDPGSTERKNITSEMGTIGNLLKHATLNYERKTAAIIEFGEYVKTQAKLSKKEKQMIADLCGDFADYLITKK